MNISGDVYTAYSGKSGCACGCNGKYFKDKRNIKRIAKKIESLDPKYLNIYDFGCVNWDDGVKSYSVYFPSHLGDTQRSEYIAKPANEKIKVGN